ncbi:hypothetical protein IPF36_34285, partial [Cupriavidus sp. IK-TO18]|nr:hypothetical protein [Cupriavidus sp. IK-TO18]
MFIKGSYKVTIDGRDVTSRLRPLLKDLCIERAAGEAADSLDLTLADPYGGIVMPRDRAPVEVELNGQWGFI